MTEILCKWLNDEVQLEPKLAASDLSFGEKFSNGYLFGHILYKHDLQPDFCLFSKGVTSESKLNNFLRLEPTFKLLSIPFNFNVARDIMNAKSGAAVQLMYQLFMALNRKTERKHTAQSLECMQPPAQVKLQRVETAIFHSQLRNQTPRQVDLNFQELIEKFKEQKRALDEKIADQRIQEEREMFQKKLESCKKSLAHSRAVRERQSMHYTKLKPLSVHSKRARSYPSIGPTSSQQAALRARTLAEETAEDIRLFELSLKAHPNIPSSSEDQALSITTDSSDKPTITLRAEGSLDYLSSIRQRVADNTVARTERDKRRRRALVLQMNALLEQEDLKREKLLIERLARRCQQERRIATQLMHIRKEKDTIRNNRILRQKQYDEQRELEFKQALDREAALAMLEEKEKMERLRHHKEIYRRHMAEKAEKCYQKNFITCHKMVLQMLDLSTKIAYYRELTNKLVPAKMVRDWKTLFIAGRSLYEENIDVLDLLVDVASSSLTRSSGYTQPDVTNDQLLNDIDFQEYKEAVSEWSPTDSLPGTVPDPTNPILHHIVYRLLDQVDPPQPPPTPPYMPKFLLQAAITGKPFSGKTTVLNHLRDKYDLIVVSIEEITSKAVETYLSEKKALESQGSANKDRHSSGLYKGESSPPLESSRSVSCSSLTPQIALNPSSSLELVGSAASEAVLPMESDEGNVGSQQLKEKGEGGEGEKEVKGSDTTTGELVAIEISQEHILQLSPLGLLGHKAYTAMANGEAIDDALIIDIFLHEVRSFPEGSGWILDNFPTTVSQAELLAEALSIPPSPKPNIPRDFVLLGERKGTAEKHHACGLNIVFHLMASTDTILARASHQDKLEHSNKLEQIQHRVMAYSENWPPLRRWLCKFKVVSNIDANMELGAICEVASATVLEVINKNKQADAMKKLGYEDVLSCGSVTSLASILTTHSSAKHPPQPVSKSKSRTTRTHSQHSYYNKASRPSSAETNSPHRVSWKSGKRKPSKTPDSPLHRAVVQSRVTRAESVKTEWVPINLDTQPGGPEWTYFFSAISNNIAGGLAGKWPAIETTFISTLKQIFQQLRDERECICQYFFIRRKEFSTYLCRPDHKQEFISQWQENYNNIDPYLRCEDIMKSELHHRIDDLGDKLWDICEHRKESSKEEQNRIAEEQWLEDHIGLLTNHYISIMQAELDRFQDTILLLKDYYNCSEDKIPDKLPDMARVGLLELKPTDPQEVPSSQEASSHSLGQPASSQVDPRTEDGTLSTPTISSVRKRITLIPRQPPPDPLAEEKGHKTSKTKSYSLPAGAIQGMVEVSEGSLDQQLINYAFDTALIAVVSMVHGEVRVLDSIIAEAKKPPKPKTPPPEAREEKTGKGRKGKNSPAAKKRGKTPPGKKGAPPEPPPESPKPPTLTQDEIISKQRKLHMCKEFKEAILIEEKRIRTRLELIRVKSLGHVEMLVSTGAAMQEEMDEWVQTCYDQEMTSVNHLLDVLRQAVENEKKLVNEVALPGVKFEIKESIITFVPSPPPTPPPVVEMPDLGYFTIEQLRHLHTQLASVCPSGFMLVKVLVDTLQAVTNQAAKEDALPQLWQNASRQQLEIMVEQLYGPDMDFVDWRRFLMSVALPWPLPSSQDMCEAWSVLVANKNTVGKKWVGKADYMAAEIWLDRATEQAEGTFNRNLAFKEALFDMFSKKGVLDVKQTLLYLCADPYPRAGLFKALSLVTGFPLTPHQDIDEQVTILLEDFHQVITLGLYPNISVTMKELLEGFVQVDPSNPNEVCLSALLANKMVAELLHPNVGYYLPELLSVLKPAYPPSAEATS